MAEQISRGWTNANHKYTRRLTSRERRQEERRAVSQMIQQIRAYDLVIQDVECGLIEDEDLPELPTKNAYAGWDD